MHVSIDDSYAEEAYFINTAFGRSHTATGKSRKLHISYGHAFPLFLYAYAFFTTEYLIGRAYWFVSLYNSHAPIT